MKKSLFAVKYMFMLCAALILGSVFIFTDAKAAELSATNSVDRVAGECSYSVTGLDASITDTMTLKVVHKNSKESAYEKKITLTSENCKSGTYKDKLSLADLNNDFDTYSISFLYGSKTVEAGDCDFSIHTSQLSMTVGGSQDAASRNFVIASSEAVGGAAVPGQNNTVSIAVWPQGTDEAAAKTIASGTALLAGNTTVTADLTQAGSSYGTWNAKAVLNSTGKVLAISNFEVAPVYTSFVVNKSKTLEKKQSFRVTISGLKNTFGIKKLTFYVYDKTGKKVASVAGTKKTADGSKYSAEVTMKKLGNKLGLYSVKASLTDNNGVKKLLEPAVVADQRMQKGTLSITKKKNATCNFSLKKAYLPGNIQKVQFVLYKKEGKKLKTQGTYVVKKTAGLSSISYKVHNEGVGTYQLKVYGYTAWGKKVLINKGSYKLSKKHLGKNGWFYEKYAGKKYKFYYVNNIKQIDLTKVLDLKKGANKYYIEINRAASAVTIYLYNEDTNKYDIPVKTCAVSVGADTWTKAGTGGLNEKSSYTPIGTYSICSNGESTKYALKPMHEPDGSVVYARWASHIVGNVYFHSIAVGSPSHYSLPYYTYNRLGSPCSAGCVRMTVADSKWIYDYVPAGTTVKIKVGNSKKAGPLGKAPVIKTTSGINYDPTDPAVPDSRKKKDYKAKRITGYMTKSGKKVGY